MNIAGRGRALLRWGIVGAFGIPFLVDLQPPERFSAPGPALTVQLGSPRAEGKRRRRSKATVSNQQACERWCKAEQGCAKCSPLLNCGIGYQQLKRFRGRGKNWSACGMRGSASGVGMWPLPHELKRSQRALVVSLGGAFSRYKRDGIEWFCEDYLKAHRDRLVCVGAVGSIWTASGSLANRIERTVRSLRLVSGSTPRVILIGKSMGGCKLHHATGKLKGVDVDLFVGVDMSCSVECHAKSGSKDALAFPSRVKRLVAFYQMKPGEKQCGHLAHYRGHGIDAERNIDVNHDGFDPAALRRRTGAALCDNVGHMGDTGIDRCDGLKRLIRTLVLRTAGLEG